MRKFEIGISLFLLITSLVAVWQSALLPAGSFDALGSAGFPIVIASLIGVLSMIILARACFMRREVENKADDQFAIHSGLEETLPTYGERNDLALAFFSLTFFYVLALALELSTFGILTTLYLVIALSFLNKITTKSLVLNILISSFLGFGCESLFTMVFNIDLP